MVERHASRGLAARVPAAVSGVVFAALAIAFTIATPTFDELYAPVRSEASSLREPLDGHAWSIRVHDVRRARSVRDTSGEELRSIGEFVVVDATVTGRDSHAFVPEAAVVDADGVRWWQTERISIVDGSIAGSEVGPGLRVRGTYVMEVPRDMRVRRLLFARSQWGSLDDELEVPVPSLEVEDSVTLAAATIEGMQ